MELTARAALPLRAAALAALVSCWTGGLLAGCGSPPTQVKGPVQDLPLTVEQIPFPGFEVEAHSSHAGYYSNRRLAAGDSAQLQALDRAGRETGFERDFTRAASPVQAVGPVVIESSVSLYRNASGAGQGLKLLGRQLVGAGATPISTGTLGQAVLGYVLQKPLNGVAYDSFIIAWRQANAVAVIQAEGTAATMDVQYALQLARIQQRRLERG
ncbi:MAG: hypothetical protein WBU92_01290 [Candidatus Dormiibacterota bacterium]